MSLSHRARPQERFVLHVGRFVARRGEAIALVGPSGSGKSTLLNLFGLAQRPDAGGEFRLTLRDGTRRDVMALWAGGQDRALTDLRGSHQGYVLQQGGLLPFLRVRENIALALDLAGRPRADAVERIAAELGIGALLDRPIGALSVGQRQRVAIARALVHRPEVILADEPTANVHPSMAEEVLALLVAQARQHDALLLMATHDPARAAAHGFDFVEVSPGPMTGAESGTASQVWREAAA